MRTLSKLGACVSLIVALVSLCLATPVSATAKDDAFRFADTDEMRYLRVFFPSDATPSNQTVIHKLPDPDERFARDNLQSVVDGLAEKLEESRNAILRQLEALGVDQMRWPAGTAKSQVLIASGAKGLAAVSQDGRITVSSRAIRGFLAGSLREASAGQTPEALMFSLFVGWPPSSLEEPLAPTWFNRFHALLGLLEDSEPIVLGDALNVEGTAILTQRFEQVGPEDFDVLARDVASGERVLTPGETFVLSSGMMVFTTSIARPAERFLLAHELGHVALGHASVDTSDCEALQRVERDADAFAVTLLAYDMEVGGITAMMYLFEQTGEAPEAFLDREMDNGVSMHRGRFGFPHALRYGMAEGGLLEETPTCKLPSPAERETRTDGLWRDVMARRLNSLGPVIAYNRQHPPFAASRKVDVLMTVSEEAVFAQEAQDGCRGSELRVEHFPGQGSDRQITYIARCLNAPPGTLLTDEARQLAGPDLMSFWEGLYPR